MMPTADELARFAVAVTARFGLRIDLERAGELIERRAQVHREPIAAYLDRLDDPAELRVLATELTVGETYFFRHIEQFRAFADVAVPDRLARGRLQVLSVGCSSGEEPYTLAMLLRASHPGTAFAIRAIDVNPAAIARARAGRYSRWSLRAITPVFEQRWFHPDGRDVVVAPELRADVTFEVANVFDDSELASAGRWDIVFCRNMMMYFTDNRADAVIARLARAITPGGYLFLGHAETLRGRTTDFALCHTHGTFYYQRSTTAAATTTTVTTATGIAVTAAVPHDAGLAVAASSAGWYEDIHAATQRVHDMVDVALDQSAGPAAGQAAIPVIAPPPVRASAAGPIDLRAIHELLGQERFGEALAQLDRLHATTAGHPDVAMIRALVLTHAGRFVEARAACGALLAIDPTSAGANYLLALCCDSTGDTDGATHQAQLAVMLDPSFAMARLHLGLLARRVGDREIASRELTRALALLEREAPARLALYGGGFSRQALLGMCRAELTAIGAPR
jgi:chemotaxis protein methyltransferase CheR